jgi:periplasmic protein TonB
MQTLAHRLVVFLAAALLLAPMGCAHRSVTRYPPSDAFFTNPPPQGELTPALAGPGDRPPQRKAPAHAEPAAAAPAGAAAAPAAAATGAATPSAAAGAAAGASAGAAAPAAAAAAAASAAAKPSSAAADTAHLWPMATTNAHVDELPVALTRVPPKYPDAARAAGTQGTVQLQAFVKTDGSVGDVKVTVSVPGLDEAAMACVRQWTFKPAQADGKAVEAWVGVPVKFTIH